MIALLASLLVFAAQEPADAPDPPSANTREGVDDPTARGELDEPTAEELLENDALFERARLLKDPFPRCRQMLLSGASARAAACYRARVSEGDPESELALELARLAEARAQSLDRKGERTFLPASAVDFLRRNGHELALHGALYGMTGGFLVSAAGVSALRLDTARSLPVLVGSAAVGAASGLALGVGTGLFANVDAGDLGLVTSALWVGTGVGTGLQLAVFGDNDDIAHIPWRFITVLSAGMVPALAAGVLAPFVHVEAGDASFAISAAVWSTALTYFTWSTVTMTSTVDRASAATMAGVASAAYLGALLLHPWLDVPRMATWLIDAGGLAGLILAVATRPMLVPLPEHPPWVEPLLSTSSVGVGVIAGTTAAFLLAPFIRELPSVLPALEEPGATVHLAPTLVPGVQGAPPTWGAAMEARF